MSLPSCEGTRPASFDLFGLSFLIQYAVAVGVIWWILDCLPLRLLETRIQNFDFELLPCSRKPKKKPPDKIVSPRIATTHYPHLNKRSCWTKSINPLGVVLDLIHFFSESWNAILPTTFWSIWSATIWSTIPMVNIVNAGQIFPDPLWNTIVIASIQKNQDSQVRIQIKFGHSFFDFLLQLRKVRLIIPINSPAFTTLARCQQIIVHTSFHVSAVYVLLDIMMGRDVVPARSFLRLAGDKSVSLECY